ncbi:hypothetical protein EG329_005275 [Mollisiaceae sp. DMI_Dod_QoI]|nr:hypothetical protein EG329_005275 [Helotiales sp. DMI_Dod_QoI]
MESPPPEPRPPSAWIAEEDPFDAFIDFSTQDPTAFAGSTLIDGFNRQPASDIGKLQDTTTTTCHRVSGKASGDDISCFCSQCQDQPWPAPKKNDESSNFECAIASNDQSSTSCAAISTALPLFSSPSTSTLPLSPPSLKRQHRDSKGIRKTTSHRQNFQPKALISQLEVMFQDDENSSAEFKWKTSILFHELRRLVDSELSSQRLCTTNEIHESQTSPSTIVRNQKRTGKKKHSKLEAPKKIFHCTSSPCRYASSSSMDWKRHEETHWPQKRYLCLDCPVSVQDSDFPDALKCFFCLHLLLNEHDIHEHILQYESARRNGRTFARKDKLSDHLQKDHLVPPSSAMLLAATWAYEIDGGWPRLCGFCRDWFNEWEERAKHLIEDHFKQGADMSMWQPPILGQVGSHEGSPTEQGLPTSNNNKEDDITIHKQYPSGFFSSFEAARGAAGWQSVHTSGTYSCSAPPFTFKRRLSIDPEKPIFPSPPSPPFPKWRCMPNPILSSSQTHHDTSGAINESQHHHCIQCYKYLQCSEPQVRPKEDLRTAVLESEPSEDAMLIHSMGGLSIITKNPSAGDDIENSSYPRQSKFGG